MTKSKKKILKTFQNKRVSRRKTCFVPIEGKKGGAFAETQTVDISKGGIGILSRRPIPIDEKIAVEIATSPDDEPILVLGQVVWVRKLAIKDRYRIGMKFQKAFSSEALKKLSRSIVL